MIAIDQYQPAALIADGLLADLEAILSAPPDAGQSELAELDHRIADASVAVYRLLHKAHSKETT